ncbi:hypothetical protein JCM9279_005132 [Rhodotorula babjevae]
MQPNGPPYYDPRDPPAQLPPLRYSTGFSTYANQTPSWVPQLAGPPPPPLAPHLRLVNPYAPAYQPSPFSSYGAPPHLAQHSSQLGQPGPPFRLDPPPQPSSALSRSPQLPPQYPSRSSSATSTASQTRTSSTNSSQQQHARDDFSRVDSPPTDLQLSAQRYWAPKLDTMSGSDYAHRVQAEVDLSGMTVDKLKLAIRNTNQHLSLHMRVSGKKNDLYSTLINQLSFEYGKPDKSRFHTMRAAISAAKIGSTNLAPVGGYYNANAGYGNYGASTSTAAAVNAYGAPAYGSTANGGAGYGAPAAGAAGAAAAARAGASTSTAAATNVLPTPRFGGAGAYGTGAAAAAAAVNGYGRVADDVPIRFRPSPFFRIDKFVSPVVTMPKAFTGDRKTVVCPITLTEAQRALIAKSNESPSNPQWQVRLYCTSDTNYNQLRSHVNQFPAPVEYPGVCEIKINGVTIAANTKGIKKQPGTAPPVNLSPKAGTALSLAPGAPNRAEVHYINTDKVFYLIAYLVEYTPVDKVVNRVKAGKTKSKEEVIQSIIAINSDEDVDASALGVSLRDPLAYTRIDIPIRSAHCEHIACFDATTWFEVNEQTPQWQCPICSKTLKVDDIVVDGYFEDILKVCSSAVEAVTVEPDGTWRSDNDKYGTAKPRSSLASANASGRNTPIGNGNGAGAGAGERGTPGSGGGGGAASDKGKQRANGELVLLSDDESDDSDAPLAKRRRVDYGGGGGGSASVGTGGSSTPLGGGGGARRREVVDLTLSSDDEDEPRAGAGAGGAAARPTSTTTAASATPGAAPPPPPPPMERQSSDRKTAAEVDRDIQAMQERMVRDYGPNWKQQFGY